MSNYVALKLANLDDQQFLPAVEEKFRFVQESLARYAQKHGPKAIGAKAVLTVKVTLAVEKSEDPSIKAEIEAKIPADPAHRSMAEFGSDEHGLCVKVQRAGSYDGEPRQGRMFTHDGRRIDQQTGEIPDSPANDEGVVRDRPPVDLNQRLGDRAPGPQTFPPNDQSPRTLPKPPDYDQPPQGDGPNKPAA